MAYLEINGKDYEGQVKFKFCFVADEKHTQKNKDGIETQSGVQYLYSKVLGEDPMYLAYFWECALAHHKQKPTLNDIQEALDAKAGEEEDYDALFQEAFQMMDNSGFLKGQIRKYWKEQRMNVNFAEKEEEKKAYKEYLKDMEETRKELNPSITDK